MKIRTLRGTEVAITALLLGGCAHHVAPPPAAPPFVATAIANNGIVIPSELLPGIIAPFQNVAIQSTLAEPADSVAVQEGDHVRRGQVLARLDTADLQANLEADLASAASDRASTTHVAYAGSLSIAQGTNQVSSALSALRQAQATLQIDRINLERDRSLLAHGYVPEQQYQQQQTLVTNDEQAVRAAAAALSSAQSNVAANGTLGSGGLAASSIQQAHATEQMALSQANQVRVQIAKATVVSPVDGVVVNRALNPGEYPGTRQIFTVQQVDPVYAILRGSGQQIARIHLQMPAEVVASDIGSRPLHGTVAAVLNQINPGSTNFIVKILLPNADARLRPGMAVETRVTLPALHGVRVPTTAFTDDTHTSMMIVKGDTIATASVRETGGDGRTSVVIGIAAGTRVVADGQAGLADGQRVATR